MARAARHRDQAGTCDKLAKGRLVTAIIRHRTKIPIATKATKLDRPCVYILATNRHGDLDIGATSNLFRLMAKHTQSPGAKRLVYVEFFEDMPDASQRADRLNEKQRAQQISLIEKLNPNWLNLFDAETGQLLAGPNDQG